MSRLVAVIVPVLLAWVTAASAHTTDETTKLGQQAARLFNERKYDKALAAQREVVAGTEKVETARHGKPGEETAGELGRAAWYALFARAPAEALGASERAHKLDPESLLIDTNRAHALLFLGRTDAARRLYLTHKGKRISPASDKTWEDTVAEDFDALRRAGIRHKAFPRVLAQLGVKHPELNAEVDAARMKVDQLLAAGKYREAAGAAETYVTLTRKRYGEERSEFAGALDRLANSKTSSGQRAEAEPLYQRSLAIREAALGHENPLVALSLNNLAELYRVQGRYAEAEPLFRRGLAILEKALGPEDAAVAALLNNLAVLHGNQGRHTEAEPLLRRSLTITEKALGPGHPSVAESLDNLAEFYQVHGPLAEVEPLYRRALAIREAVYGRDHPSVATSLDNLGSLFHGQGRNDEAEALIRRALAINEAALGREHPSVANSLNSLAELYRDQARYAEAEPLYQRALAIREAALGREDPLVATSLNNLAELYRNQGRYAEAEPLYRRSLAIYEKVRGPGYSGVGTALNNLARLYQDQGRYAEAEPLYQRALTIRESTLGRDHTSVATTLMNLAWQYRVQGRYAEAEPLYQRALAINESALGREHTFVAASLDRLARLYRDQGRYAEAEPLYRRALAIDEVALGREHPYVAATLNSLGGLFLDQGRDAEAEPLYQRALAIREAALGREHPDVAASLNSMAMLAFSRSDWAGAADYWRRSTGILQGRAERGLVAGRGEVFAEEARRLDWQFLGLVKMTHRLTARDRWPAGRTPASDTFETAQWSLASDAAASLAQMSARSATGSPELADLVRQRQDLIGAWHVQEKMLIATKGAEPGKRNAPAEKALADSLAGIDARLAAIDKRLLNEFPDYAALSRPTPASIAEVQAQLGATEALVLFLDTPAWTLRAPNSPSLPEETFVWVVTRSEVRWMRSELGTEALKQEVAALRCGLDEAVWDDAAKAERCVELVGKPRNDTGGVAPVLPFDLGRAHALYRELLGPAEDMIAGKHLLIVPSGALTQLPFQVLVTAPPKTALPDAPAEYRDAAWLGTRQPITVLPAVSSLKALRALAKASRAVKPYLGIGNPLLDGDRNDANDAARAKAARTRQTCAPVPIEA
ncbi:MAG: tetratricopeptide repeat protein, partial [Hyphomicrobiaceae bacterium]|nr:tetratricopeptide repeat protein [Hyphomicrobiaceae bacterium]